MLCNCLAPRSGAVNWPNDVLGRVEEGLATSAVQRLLIPDLTVDRFAHDVEMTSMASSLLKHVHQYPAQGDVTEKLVRSSAQYIERWS